jgi:hypothetical protein
MAKKTVAQKEYDAWLRQKMDAIETPRELIEFIKAEHAEKTRAMNSALDELTAILAGNRGS